MLTNIVKGKAGLDANGERLRQVFKQLDGAPNSEVSELIRLHLAEHQDTVGNLQERLRATLEEGEMQARRRAEVEKMLSKRDAAYEELLGQCLSAPVQDHT